MCLQTTMITLSAIIHVRSTFGRQISNLDSTTEVDFVATTVDNIFYSRRHYNDSTGEIRYTGMCFTLLNEITNALNLTYRIHEGESFDWGMLLPDGKYQR